MSKFYTADNDATRLYFYCPGCECDHMIVIAGDRTKTPVWDFNGDMNLPTVSPSILVSDEKGTMCHFYINHGQIQYLSDCRHRLAGSNVEMKDCD